MPQFHKLVFVSNERGLVNRVCCFMLSLHPCFFMFLCWKAPQRWGVFLFVLKFLYICLMKRTLFGLLMLFAIVCTSSFAIAADATEKQFLDVATEVSDFDFDGLTVEFIGVSPAILANGFEMKQAVYPLVYSKSMHGIELEFDSGLFPLPREFVIRYI